METTKPSQITSTAMIYTPGKRKIRCSASYNGGKHYVDYWLENDDTGALQFQHDEVTAIALKRMKREPDDFNDHKKEIELYLRHEFRSRYWALQSRK